MATSPRRRTCSEPIPKTFKTAEVAALLDCLNPSSSVRFGISNRYSAFAPIAESPSSEVHYFEVEIPSSHTAAATLAVAAAVSVIYNTNIQEEVHDETSSSFSLLNKIQEEDEVPCKTTKTNSSSSTLLEVQIANETLESFNPEVTRLRLQLSSLMATAMASLKHGDFKTFRYYKNRVTELQNKLAEAEAVAYERAQQEIKERKEASLKEAESTPLLDVPETSDDVNQNDIKSDSKPTFSLVGYEVSIPDTVVCYSQDSVVVSYGVLCRYNGKDTKIYRRYNEFKVLHEQAKVLRTTTKSSKSLPSFPGSKLFGATNRSKKSIDRRQQDLEAYIQHLLDPALGLLESQELYNFFVPQPTECQEDDIQVRSLWRLAPSLSKLYSSIRICIWPFEVQRYAGEDVFAVNEVSTVSREEAGMRYRVLINFQRWVSHSFKDDQLPTERHYQLFLYSPLAFNSALSDPFSYFPAPANNSEHLVQLPNICDHTTVRLVRNGRRYNSSISFPSSPFCEVCNDEKDCNSSNVSLCSVNTNLQKFKKCCCTEQMFCQVPGREARYISNMCDVVILVQPPFQTEALLKK